MKKKEERTKKYFENDKYEQFLGIESTEIVYNNRYHDDYYRYEPTSYNGLISGFDAIEEIVTKYDRLVDFGCGKGRVLFYVQQRFQCEVCGIEIDADLYEKALDNRAYFNTRFRGSSKNIEIVHGKAEEYQIQWKDNFFYFFNPFETNIFEQVIENIKMSVNEHPRKVYIMMYYPKEEYLKYLRKQFFKLYRIAKLPSYDVDWDEKVVIFEYSK